jgi:DNA-binding winged helix-turn-helix (wHTH) protein
MSGTEPLRLRFDSFELDEANARLTRDGRPLALPPKAFDVLCALARRPGQLVTKTELLDAVWGHQYVSDSVLKTAISDLRAALGDDAKLPRYIETAARRGYRFIGAAVVPTSSVASASLAASAAQPAPDAAPLIGRQAALARLRAAWSAALAGQRKVVWVAGEAGIGKTTLIARFTGLRAWAMRRAARRG